MAVQLRSPSLVVRRFTGPDISGPARWYHIQESKVHTVPKLRVPIIHVVAFRKISPNKKSTSISLFPFHSKRPQHISIFVPNGLNLKEARITTLNEYSLTSVTIQFRERSHM
jgi:hypothetical protein